MSLLGKNNNTQVFDVLTKHSSIQEASFAKGNLHKIKPGEGDGEFEGLPDIKLWAEFKDGNERAFIYIYKKYFPQLYNYGSQFTKDNELIEDCIQDLFIEIRKKQRNLCYTDSIKLYLFKSLRRKIIALVQKNNKLRLKNCSVQEFEVTFSVEHYIINQQLNEENVLRLNKAIGKLSPRQKEAIYYFYYEDFSYKQIAEMMNMSHIRSARNLIYRSLDLLKITMASV